MTWRRSWQNQAWNYGRRGLRAYGARRAPPLPLEQKTPALLSSARMILSRNAFASVSSAKFFELTNPYFTKKCYFSSDAWVDLPVGVIVEVPLAQTGEGIAECELLKWFVQEVGETLLKMVVEESSTPTMSADDKDNITFVKSDICDSSHEILLSNKDNIGGALSTPAVRNLAKQYGVNINDIHGTGKDGRVLKEDVLKYITTKGIFREPSASSQETLVEQLPIKEEKSSYTFSVDGWHYEDSTVSLRGFQRSMVKSMTMAAKVPHFHYLEEINCDALVELKAAFQSENSDPQIKHTYLPFLIKSLSMALSKHPSMNSSFNEESHEVILKGCHNIGVAMATPYGLVVPNIKKVQSLSILEVTKELSRLQQLAINNKLSTEDISGGTITLSNIGAIGGKFGSPLLNLPEVAIIAMGRIQKLPRFADDGNVYPASILNVNIGADHRVVDGATVARFCNEWKLLIEKPELLLLHMR
ncbi:PREDICTED: lipoamide acyltransferase component of branched-chain alpha-keto acid dehydrogenase complex, mitochondrial isoform X2 [Nelumbo nucifera]|uniref:Lipoamide acyltransferase component of branched-chain alpha-keto acid dehydrogenase complex, mitochondrial isoform X2 n=1 Tax=Nelumbo nucifera TaxID=4432 RepID=A0A1U8A3V1_NELNU|nr:PREDICTED: lipoamide acyltransferase component of branched-chain alpha-keto acid dehydrogenase complex, mitochondrial isoform X2 [Nelumbo nucifera]